MGLYDRDYAQDKSGQQYESMPQMRFGLPKLTAAVKWLLVINVVVFSLTYLIKPLAEFSVQWFSVFPEGYMKSLQLWRLVTYQFLHDYTGLGHILFNMLTLYFFGPMLENTWGGKKFLTFYLICGAAGGFFYPFLALIKWLPVAPLVGASGAILGIIAADAILYPSTRVYLFWGLFPIPLIILAGAIALISVLVLLRPDLSGNAGGEAAHLAGMVTGAAYCLTGPIRAKISLKSKASRWKKQLLEEQRLQTELDRILEKVHQHGLHSLSAKEKRILKKATHLEQSKKTLF